MNPKKIRGTSGFISTGDILCTVNDVGKREAVTGREFFHVVKAIGWIRLGIIGHYRDRADPGIVQCVHVRYNPVNHRFYIRAVVADKHDDRSSRALDVAQRIRFPVHSRQREVDCLPSKITNRRLCGRHCGPRSGGGKPSATVALSATNENSARADVRGVGSAGLRSGIRHESPRLQVGLGAPRRQVPISIIVPFMFLTFPAFCDPLFRFPYSRNGHHARYPR